MANISGILNFSFISLIKLLFIIKLLLIFFFVLIIFLINGKCSEILTILIFLKNGKTLINSSLLSNPGLFIKEKS